MEKKTVADAAARYGVNVGDATCAAELVAGGQVDAIAMSGKQGSGKDSHALALLEARGRSGPLHGSFAAALKEEVNALLTLWAAVDGRTEPFVDQAACRFNIPKDAGRWYAGRFGRAPLSRLARWDAHRREELPAEEQPLLREILQYHGTDCRRRQDPNYWIQRAVRPAIAAMLDGRSVLFTDVRFPNEADAALALGMTLFRLDVSPAVQRDRLLARDGAPPAPASLTHPSETSLDDYPHFHLRVDNDGSFGEVQQQLQAFLTARPEPALAG